MMNIETPEGMQQAIHWMENHISMLAENASWTIPRSLSAYSFNKKDRIATLNFGMGDSSTERVLRQMGWTIHRTGPSYVINGKGDGILCFECWRISHHPEDIKNKYCGFCHKWHEPQNN